MADIVCDISNPQNAFQGPCPYERVNWISKITFRWMNSLFRAGRRNKLTREDIYDVNTSDQTSILTNRLEKIWNEEKAFAETKQKDPNLFKATLSTFKRECCIYGIFRLVSVIILMIQPFLLGELIGYFQPHSDLSVADAIFVAVALPVSGLIRLICQSWHFFKANHLGMQMKAAVGGIIYRKILKISSLELHKSTSGKIVNHLSTDLETFHTAAENFHNIWSAPILLITAMFLIYRSLGVTTLFMLPVMVCLVPIQYLVGRSFADLRIKVGAKTDKRIYMMNEIITGMRAIKMYCWEKPFSRVISELRKTEVKHVWFGSLLKAVNLSFFFMGARILTLAVFVPAWLLDIKLSSATIFKILGWIEVLRYIIFIQFFLSVEHIVQMYVSVKRIQSFLVLEEIQDNHNVDTNSHLRCTSNMNAEYTVEICNMTSVWVSFNQSNPSKRTKTINRNTDEDGALNKAINEENEEIGQMFKLKDINLKIKKGELIAVVGSVGSGKSSLLMTLLGELPATEGHITVNGSIAYVSQQPWVISGTVKSNIQLGLSHDAKKYNKVVDACALKQDIENMVHGDMTLVGERGLLLSGGQKARLTLARNIYKDADVYLLDDPFGAVDTAVGKHIFDKCVCQYLEGKTRIVVTHQLQYLTKVDRIVVLKNGKIRSFGTFDELIKNNTELSLRLSELQNREESKVGANETDRLQIQENNVNIEVEEEDLERGTVGWRVYLNYITPKFPFVTIPLILALILLTECSLVYGDWNLASWADLQDELYNRRKLVWTNSTHMSLGTSSNDIRGDQRNCQSLNDTSPTSSIPAYEHNITTPSIVDPMNDGRIAMETFTASVGVHVITMILTSVLFMSAMTFAGKRLHDRMFGKVIGARTRFFDSNPVGRILNRFARDMGIVDLMVPTIACYVFELSFRSSALAIATSVVNPFLLVPLCPLLVLIILTRHYSLNTIRHLKRVDAVTKSPLFSHVSDTLQGLQTIRAMNKSEDFVNDFDAYQDRHTIAGFLFHSSFRWFSFRSTFVVIIYFFIVVVMSLIFKDVMGITGGLFGLSVSYAMSLAEPFESLVRFEAILETYMTSVERITAYTSLEQESEKTSGNTPPQSWPGEGEIIFKNFCLRYSETSPLVLKDLDCVIRGTEKIGIVGRTGAGKSSILAAILRLAEPTGTIIIDGVDTKTIGLHELRMKISVISQDPVLFGGNLRRNLDPFEEFSDERLWYSLEQVELKSKIEGMPGQLYTEMSEGGKNLSVGQRQLLCLARAILYDNKILILDEATANVDLRTDSLIQKTIRQRFQACTVITIAHRLNTIMDSDRVMVLDNGRLAEFDVPHKLLQIRDGLFRKLVDQTGKAQTRVLESQAEKAYRAINEESVYL